VPVAKRCELFFDAFTARRTHGPIVLHTPFATLVKKLQESLTRMENLEVITVASGADGQFPPTQMHRASISLIIIIIIIFAV
jgi:hypothetical protein